MNKTSRGKWVAVLLVGVLLGLAGHASAQGKAEADAVAQANNPLADSTEVNVDDYDYSVGQRTDTDNNGH